MAKAKRKYTKRCKTCGQAMTKAAAKLARAGVSASPRKASKVDGRRGPKKFKCPVAGCRKKSRGPRYELYCAEHQGKSKAAKAAGLLKVSTKRGAKPLAVTPANGAANGDAQTPSPEAITATPEAMSAASLASAPGNGDGSGSGHAPETPPMLTPASKHAICAGCGATAEFVETVGGHPEDCAGVDWNGPKVTAPAATPNAPAQHPNAHDAPPQPVIAENDPLVTT